MRSALSLEFRFLIWANLGVAVIFGLLLFFLPTYTEIYAPWVFSHPRSAILIGVGYLSAAIYYVSVLRQNDWVQARNGALNLIVFSLVLLFATSTDWSAFRAYHPITLAWLFYYYANPLFVPMIARSQNIITQGASEGEVEVAPPWRAWLSIRGIFYLAVALFIFLFVDTARNVWPWPTTGLDLRVFTGFIAVVGLSGAAAIATVSWQRLRLGLVFSGALGLLHLVGLLAGRVEYNWSAPLGILLPVMFAEWFLTSLALHVVYRKQ
ncbi:MAG: hypothetical protein HYZ49_17060 [Chloroflexi bacterium]|nr:hypothetical protein [Chloroflexota bacterium]